LSGKLPIGEIVGRHYKIDEVNEAISDMLVGEPGRGVISF
jgi:Zn-dependent alcohol dehydrogenase